jgi:hypothetical protein
MGVKTSVPDLKFFAANEQKIHVGSIIDAFREDRKFKKTPDKGMAPLGARIEGIPS